MNAYLLEAIVGMFLVTLVASFALAFAEPADAQRSVASLRARRRIFRIGIFGVAAGVVFTVQADAVTRLSGLTAADPGTFSTRAAGWFLILLGVAVLDVVLWWPGARVETAPA